MHGSAACSRPRAHVHMPSTAVSTPADAWRARLQVQVKDGRVLVGDFNCLDKQGNIIMTNTYEVMQLNGR